MNSIAEYYYKFYNKKQEVLTEYSEEQALQKAIVAKKYGFVDIKYALFHRTRIFTANEYSTLLVQRIINNCHIHLPDFPPTALDFLAVATATPSKICLVSEKSFYMNIAETYYSLY